MIKIILVEDEPSAMRYLRSIIEQRCNGFEIIDTAENGAEGLEKVRMLKPDIVITDIKMPVMDGIGLVSSIKEEYPDICSIIVSGYQDFEYAKGAIKSGVVDYLLKPVNIGQMKELLEVVRKKLYKEYYEKRIGLLKKILSGIQVDNWQIEKYLSFRYYSAAILREKGLPSRFSSSRSGTLYGSTGINTVNGIIHDQSMWVLPGRDEQEFVFIHTPEIISRSAFEKLVTETAEQIVSSYYTIIFTSNCFKLPDCKAVISNLYRILDNNIVLGFSQTINELSESRNTVETRNVLDGTMGNKIGFLVSNGMYNDLKKEFVKLFAAWEKEQCTQIWVEKAIRQILQHIERHSPNVCREESNDIEILLDEAIYYSTNFGELMANIWELVEKILQRVEKTEHKVNTPTFFNSIVKYIEQNLPEQLSLQSVCAVFGISQTYLSRLFRKYKNMSFNEYLTLERVSKARKLIAEVPNIPLKDVAALVGYNDPFYFSRVFRSITGVPPSEYMSKRSIPEN